MLRCFAIGLLATTTVLAMAQAPCSATPPSLNDVFARSIRDFEPRPIDGGVRYGAAQPWRGYHAEVSGDGVLHLQAKGVAIRASLVGIGRGNSLGQVPTATSARRGKDGDGWPKLTLDRGGNREWFVNGRHGLRHWLQISQPPKGGGLLVAKLQVQGAQAKRINDDRVSLSRNGVALLTYSGIRAWDSRGQALPAKLSAQGAAIRLEVDDRSAAYPVTIDPEWNVDDVLVPDDGVLGDDFGTAIGFKGNLAAIGAPGVDGDKGAVYVFQRDPCGCWNQQTKLYASDGAAGDNFGSAVATDGTNIVVGAPGGSGSPGKAYVFTSSPDWDEAAKLTPSDVAADNQFGTSVGVGGGTAVVGSPGNCHVYTFSQASSWAQVASLASPEASPSNFGYSVAMDGTRLVVGDPTFDLYGRAYAFDRAGAGWGLRNALDSPDQIFLGYFGFSVAISEDRILVGEPQPNSSGAAFVFHSSGGTNPFLPEQGLEPTGGVFPDSHFGLTVALSGDRALVGAPDADTQRGLAYVFRLSGGSWAMGANLDLMGQEIGDRYGCAVALDGDRALIGATLYNDSGTVFSWQGPHVELQFHEAGRTGGKPVDFEVFILEPAPAGGQTVTLTSSDPAVLFVPSSVTIPEGDSIAMVTGMSAVVATDTPVTVTAASTGFASGTGSIVIRSPRVGRIDLATTELYAHQTATATVVLNGAAPVGGQVVYLTGTTSILVPDQVTVPAGGTRAQFTITALPVGSPTFSTVTATPALTPKTAGLTVLPGRTPNLSLQYSTLSAGESMVGTIHLSESAPAGGSTVQLTSTGPIGVPATVFIAEGENTGTFTVTSQAVTGVGQVTATLGDISTHATVQVKRAVLQSVSVSPATIVGGGFTTVTVTLERPAPGSGTTVYLSTPDPHAVNLPASVFVPAGMTSAQTTATTVTVRNTVTVAIVGKVPGGGNRGAHLTLTPN